MSDANPTGSSNALGAALSCSDAVESNYHVVKTALFPTHPTYPESDLAWPGLAWLLPSTPSPRLTYPSALLPLCIFKEDVAE